MPTVRAKLADVEARVRAGFHQEAVQGAGGNRYLSKRERRALPNGILKDESLGLAGTVTVDRAADAALARVSSLLDLENQSAGPGRAIVSKSEVLALAKRDAEAGGRVARAWELLTGKKLEVPGGPVSTPPAVDPTPGSSAHAVLAASTTSGFTLTIEGGALTISGGGLDPTGHTIELDLPGRHVSVPLTTATFGGWRPRAVVEAIRAALPDKDLLVEQGSTVSSMRIRLYAKGTAPHPEGFPVYAHFLSPPANPLTDLNFVRRVHGTKSFELFAQLWDGVTPVRLVVDDRLYEVLPGPGITEGIDAIQALRAKLVADGVALDFRNYGSVVKFKLL